MSCAFSALLFTLVWLDQAHTRTVFGFAIVIGVVGSLSGPVPEHHRDLGQGDSANAIVLNSITLNAARIAGPALAGLLVASVGVKWCFAANALSFLVLLLTLVRMDAAEFLDPPGAEPTRSWGIGPAYAWRNPVLRWVLILILVVGMLAWEFQVSLPLLTKETSEREASTVGLLFGCMSFGAVAGGS